MIANPGSTLSQSALEALVERSATEKELQTPLVERKDMPGGLLSKLAKFVAAPLLKTLCGRNDLNQQSVSAINNAIESREDKPAVRAVMAESGGESSDTDVSAAAKAAARAQQLFADGSLTDEVVATALDRRENEFVVEALALRAGYSAQKVRRMVQVKSARTIVALSWKGGFTARFALDLQTQLANIQPINIINARDGVDYALSISEIEEQLSLFD